MEIRVNWMEGWANAPTFELHGNMPEMKWAAEDAPVWEKRGTLHRRDGELFVHYFHSDGKPTEGYGGRRFAGTFKNGDFFCYRGAWSSRAGCINASWPARRIVDVSFGYCATAIHADTLIAWWKANKPAWGLAWIHDAGDITLYPTIRGELKESMRRKQMVQIDL